MFGREDLRQIVQIVGPTLESEDREIRSALLSNPFYRGNGAMGLRRVDREAYYQYLVWKAMISSALPFCVVPERDYRDLWICRSPTDLEALAIGEMKRFVERNGEDVVGIEGDLRKLRMCSCPCFELVTTEYDPLGEDQVEWLANRLTLDGFPYTKGDFEISPFPTIRVEGGQKKDYEFALIGFMVARAEMSQEAGPGSYTGPSRQS